ncbi:MAG: SMC-Scp complex subunit ScpB [Alphaproteobacteria bacterium]|nr:SMC-Scp complex subunit ScpB [Alphaproteobacteria bacterium]
MTQNDVRLVEAILFASANAIDERTIAERFPADRAELIPEVLEYLRQQYEGRGVNLVQREKRWAFRTAPELAEQMKLEKEQPRKFTRSAMETMAVIAYHQPVTRAEIENIRGVATSPGALDTLMEAGWIKPGKRREVPGRPVTWLSTQAFLDHFGLERLADLPGMDELKAAGLLDKRPAIEAMPNTADLFDGAAEEGDDPQEVTDEDLIGGGEDDSVMELEEGDYEDDADDDFDDEEDDNEDEED